MISDTFAIILITVKTIASVILNIEYIGRLPIVNYLTLGLSKKKNTWMDFKRRELLTSTGQSLEKISHLLGINLASYMGKLYSFALIVLFLFAQIPHLSYQNVCGTEKDYCGKHLITKFMVMLQYIMYLLLVLTMLSTSIFRPKQFAFPRQKMIIIDSILESYGAQFSDKDIFLAKYLQDAATATGILIVTMRYAYNIIVNKNFGFQLLIISVICLNDIILLLHAMYQYMKAGIDNIKILILDVISIIAYALRFLYISYLCQRSRNEFKRMAIILHDVFLEHKSLRAEMIHFSLQLVHEDLTFTAFGLYEINIPFMCSIAGAVITYLVMVIQLANKFAIVNYNTTISSYAEDNATLT